MPRERLADLLAEGRRLIAPLDARLLLQHAAGIAHADLVADGDRAVVPAVAERYRALVARRKAGEPVSRIIGCREFYGRPFRVTPDVLDPRPDTETLIDAALPHIAAGMRILDLGCGSGAIIVTLLAERTRATGVGVDLSPAALAVTAENAAALGVADRLRLVAGSWFDGLSGVFDVIVSNPPYIPLADVAGLAVEVRGHDPHLALTDGGDGLGAYRALAAGAAAHLARGGVVVVEIGAGQGDAVAAIFGCAGWRLLAAYADLGGHQRVLKFEKS